MDSIVYTPVYESVAGNIDNFAMWLSNLHSLFYASVITRFGSVPLDLRANCLMYIEPLVQFSFFLHWIITPLATDPPQLLSFIPRVITELHPPVSFIRRYTKAL